MNISCFLVLFLLVNSFLLPVCCAIPFTIVGIIWPDVLRLSME